jgi:hypothetical protein
MDPESQGRPSLDPSLLLPILLGGFSLLGILLVLFLGRFGAGQSAAPEADTATPFKYLLIGTEPGIASPETETSTPFEGDSVDQGMDDLSTQTAVSDPTAGSTSVSSTDMPSGSNSSPGSTSGGAAATTTQAISQPTSGPSPTALVILFGTPRATSTPLPLVVRTATPRPPTLPASTSTPVPTRNITLTPFLPYPNWYDDIDRDLSYSGWWEVRWSAPGAYQDTLHVSSTVGSQVRFRFTGRQLRILYQGGVGLGTLTARINGQDYSLDQSITATEWVLMDEQEASTYTVIITHTGTGPVNIDGIFVQ